MSTELDEMLGVNLVEAADAVQDDLHYDISWLDANRVVADLGFVEVFSEDFVDEDGYHTYGETFKVFWRDGALLTLESWFGRRRVNSSKVYYNWKPADADGYYFDYVSSGGWVADDVNDKSTWVWAGDHDARDGLRHILRNLESNGALLPVWKGVSFLWLLNFFVARGGGLDFRAENFRVISHFPQHVQDAVGVVFEGEAPLAVEGE